MVLKGKKRASKKKSKEEVKSKFSLEELQFIYLYKHIKELIGNQSLEVLGREHKKGYEGVEIAETYKDNKFQFIAWAYLDILSEVKLPFLPTQFESALSDVTPLKEKEKREEKKKKKEKEKGKKEGKGKVDEKGEGLMAALQNELEKQKKDKAAAKKPDIRRDDLIKDMSDLIFKLENDELEAEEMPWKIEGVIEEKEKVVLEGEKWENQCETEEWENQWETEEWEAEEWETENVQDVTPKGGQEVSKPPEYQEYMLNLTGVIDTKVVECNFRFDKSDPDAGKLNIANTDDNKDTWLDVSIERLHVVEKSMFSQYYNNLIKTRGHPSIVQLEYIITKNQDFGDCLLVEKFDCSLGDLIGGMEVSTFWEKIELPDYYSVWRPNSLFQSILKRILKGVICLVDHQITFAPWLDNIVFLQKDKKRENPKFRRVFSLYDEFKAQEVFKKLRLLIEKVIAIHKEKEETFVKISADVTDFLKILKSQPVKTQELLQHPVFWRFPEKLQFIVEIRNMIKFNQLVVDLHFENIYSKWIKRVKTHPCVEERYYYAVDVKRKSYTNTLRCLIFFVRDQFEHINDKLHDNDIPVGEDGNPIMMLKFKNKRWTREEIGVLFEYLFPNLVTSLHGQLWQVIQDFRDNTTRNSQINTTTGSNPAGDPRETGIGRLEGPGLPGMEHILDAA